MPKIESVYKTILKDSEIVLFRLWNNMGGYVEVLNYGATLVSLCVPDKKGGLNNLILSYNKVEDYFSDQFYLGSTVGRFANRIANAEFMLDDKKYLLDKNDGNNSNHGGFAGFNTKVFDYKMEEDKLVLSCVSKSGEGGFPGNLKLTVSYSYLNDNSLKIEYKAVADERTIFNPTNHAYFNLGDKKSDILNHKLKIYADTHLEINSEFIPTGNILPVADSAFDFRDLSTIASLMPLKKEVLPGYNTYFISNSDEELKLLAVLKTEEHAISVCSTMPGIQIYTGDYLSDKFEPFSGIALEAQFYPDAPNHVDFKGCVLNPGEEVKHSIIYATNTPNP